VLAISSALGSDEGSENYLSCERAPELTARAFFKVALKHLTHDGEPRVETQADGSQNQENYLS
jgi:hypothetical protein